MEINLVDLALFFLRRWYWFVIAAVLTTAAGMAVCLFLLTPQYESKTKIIILNQQNTGTLTYSDMQMSSQLTKDYEELIVSRDVLEKVIAQCGLSDDYEELSKRIEVENVADTRIISITARDPSPWMAQRIADSVRETAAAHIRSVTDVEAVNVAEAANLPEKPAFPSKVIWAAASLLIGIFLAAVLLTMRFLADDTIKNAEDIERYLGLSTLALIPRMEPSQNGQKKHRKHASQNTKRRANHAADAKN